MCSSSEDGEKRDSDKVREDVQAEPPVEEERKPPKKRTSHKKGSPEAFMTSFFAGMDIYQTKMLVRPGPEPAGS